MLGHLYDKRHSTMRVHYREFAYETIRWLTYPNALAKRYYRGWLKFPPPFKVHLGSGRIRVPGWINIDIHPFYPKDLWMDLRNPWPFRQDEVSQIYSCHLFEHFDLIDLRWVLGECHRVLTLGGCMRVVVPSLEKAVSCYVSGDFSCFANVDPCSKSSGRKFNDAIVYHSQHKLLFDFGFLEELLTEVGFNGVTLCGFRESILVKSEDLGYLEMQDRAEDSIFVEAVKL